MVRHICFLSSSLWENTHEQPRRSEAATRNGSLSSAREPGDSYAREEIDSEAEFTLGESATRAIPGRPVGGFLLHS
jgi:hypothetical protein